MGLPNILVSGLVIVVVLSGCATASPLIQVLKAEAPAATWNEQTAIRADVTCDGIEDTIVLGHQRDTAWIGIVPGSPDASAKVKPLTFYYSIGKHTQNSFCARPVRIEPYEHACESAYGTLEDCKPVKGCKDIAVVDDECDSFHFYWTTSGEFSLWRE